MHEDLEVTSRSCGNTQNTPAANPLESSRSSVSKFCSFWQELIGVPAEAYFGRHVGRGSVNPDNRKMFPRFEGRDYAAWSLLDSSESVNFAL